MNTDSNASILNFAHRGARSVAPENTMAAFAAGWKAGAPWFELDVAASSDGVLVVMHDDTLTRTTDARTVYPDRAPWTVYDFTFAELKRLDAGSWFAAADPFKTVASGLVGKDDLARFGGEPVPALREALEFCRDKGLRVNVEIKDATGRACDPWIVERTVDLIRELRMEERTLISSFNHDYLRRVRKTGAAIELGALVEEVPPGIVGLLRELGARSLNPGLKGLRPETVREVRGAGFDVFVWTVNEAADMRRMVEAGATGIITDFPARFVDLFGT
jgi:glycerophosphoryl diester phosphodiesterase